MYESSKYGNFLTVLLIIIIIAVVGLIGFFSYRVYKKYSTEQEANKFVSNFGQNIKPEDKDENTNNKPGEIDNDPLNNVQTVETNGTTGKKQTYQGFDVSGTIEIPAIKLAYPILTKPSKSAIEKSVAIIYGPGPNQPGNTVIIGHNYRNGQFFSNNKKLAKGDKIYITDLTGRKLSYTIYDKFETEENNTDFIVRSTNGAREISLQTCTDDGKYRLIILAKCDLDN
ncbi:MAG: sortase [Clostridia bacterium]|nr:sortase [Clostridia bacterium]